MEKRGWMKHTHTELMFQQFKTGIWVFKMNKWVRAGVADWQSGHITFYHPPIKKQSLFSHPQNLGCLVISLTKSLAKVILWDFQALGLKSSSASALEALAYPLPPCEQIWTQLLEAATTWRGDQLSQLKTF